MPAPNITPFDVYTPMATAGAMTAKAIGDIGGAIDTYNQVEQLRKDKKARLMVRDEILSKYGLQPEDLSKETSFEELARVAHNLGQMKVLADQAEAEKVPRVDRRYLYKTALADKEYFLDTVGKVQKAIETHVSDKAQQESATNLQDITIGATAPQQQAPTGAPAPAVTPQAKPITETGDVGTDYKSMMGSVAAGLPKEVAPAAPTDQEIMSTVQGDIVGEILPYNKAKKGTGAPMAPSVTAAPAPTAAPEATPTAPQASEQGGEVNVFKAEAQKYATEQKAAGKPVTREGMTSVLLRTVKNPKTIDKQNLELFLNQFPSQKDLDASEYKAKSLAERSSANLRRFSLAMQDQSLKERALAAGILDKNIDNQARMEGFNKLSTSEMKSAKGYYDVAKNEFNEAKAAEAKRKGDVAYANAIGFKEMYDDMKNNASYFQEFAAQTADMVEKKHGKKKTPKSDTKPRELAKDWQTEYNNRRATTKPHWKAIEDLTDAEKKTVESLYNDSVKKAAATAKK
jgi:hypothetical protein